MTSGSSTPEMSLQKSSGFAFKVKRASAAAVSQVLTRMTQPGLMAYSKLTSDWLF